MEVHGTVPEARFATKSAKDAVKFAGANIAQHDRIAAAPDTVCFVARGSKRRSHRANTGPILEGVPRYPTGSKILH
jgi:hypothetical protein